MVKNKILTEKAMKIIDKKIKNEKLSQQDSNYLSRFVRPKLRDMMSIDARFLLKKLEYNPKARFIERKIKNILLDTIPHVDSIILCGSAIQTNYREYNDIDVIVATKIILPLSFKEKDELKDNINKIANRIGLNLDIQIYSKKSILSQYPHNPSLIYQLKDSKVIYGKIKISGKIILSHYDLMMKLDWSEGLDKRSKSSEIYYALRNTMLVFLLLNRKVDNAQLKENLVNLCGVDLLARLKNDSASKTEKKLAFSLLTSLTNYLEEEIKNRKWEKIVI